MPTVDLSKLQPVERIPGYFGRFVHSEHMTVAYWEIKAGSPIPEHDHPHEQIMTVTDGAFELVVDGVPKLLRAGMVEIIPPGVRHGGRAVTDCRVVDTFSPVREDYRL